MLVILALQRFLKGTEDRINSRLVPFAFLLEPIQHVSVNTDRNCFLGLREDHLRVFPKLGAECGYVRVVNLRVRSRRDFLKSLL